VASFLGVEFDEEEDRVGHEPCAVDQTEPQNCTFRKELRLKLPNSRRTHVNKWKREELNTICAILVMNCHRIQCLAHVIRMYLHRHHKDHQHLLLLMLPPAMCRRARNRRRRRRRHHRHHHLQQYRLTGNDGGVHGASMRSTTLCVDVVLECQQRFF
jgi:hypothetical protein